MTDMFDAAGGPPAAPGAPKPPPRMPDPLGPETVAVRRNAQQENDERRGRQSTVMTTPAGRTLAGGGYAGGKPLG